MDPIPRDFGKHPVQGGRVYDAGAEEPPVRQEKRGGRSSSSKGPTAHFLNEANNLKLSCSACGLVFPSFKAELEAARAAYDESVQKHGSDKAAEHVSAIVEGKLSAACRKVRAPSCPRREIVSKEPNASHCVSSQETKRNFGESEDPKRAPSVTVRHSRDASRRQPVLCGVQVRALG
ncbi:hypothetical protein DIPPA_33591 [Diplonema papillatum]|nr:hypothetical protein DIPPA_33591 [Diplonema papillatum]